LIPLSIIQISFLFSSNSENENSWLIPISLAVSFLDGWIGINSWFDYRLISYKIKTSLVEYRNDIYEANKANLILYLSLGLAFSVGFSSKLN
jgi:hypothetical protein